MKPISKEQELENRERFQIIYELLGKFIVVKTEQDFKKLDKELYLSALASYRNNFRPFVIWQRNDMVTHNSINGYIRKHFLEELKTALDSSIINHENSPELFI